MHGFETVEELYQWSSCINFFQGISHPIIFINSKDDPLIPDPLLEPVRQLAGEYDWFINFFLIEMLNSFSTYLV